jgi:hypothetical protein
VHPPTFNTLLLFLSSSSSSSLSFALILLKYTATTSTLIITICFNSVEIHCYYYTMPLLLYNAVRQKGAHARGAHERGGGRILLRYTVETVIITFLIVPTTKLTKQSNQTKLTTQLNRGSCEYIFAHTLFLLHSFAQSTCLLLPLLLLSGFRV